MIKVIKIKDGVATAYSIDAFKNDNKSTGYNGVISDSKLNAQGVHRVYLGVKPDEAVGFDVVEDGFPVLTEGVWLQNYISVAKGADDARTLRNDLLAATDWTANSDVTMTAEMTAYRQALRDITSQAGFPTSVTWPQEPSA